MSAQIELHCSALPVVAHCGAARIPPITQAPPTEAAQQGAKIHALIAAALSAQPSQADVTQEEAELVTAAVNAWQSMRNTLGEVSITIEQTMRRPIAEGITLVGTPDLLARAPNTLAVIDWKSGWEQYDASEQLRGYLWLAQPAAGTICWGLVGWLRAKQWEVAVKCLPRDLDAWARGLAERVTDTTERPGPYCARCARRDECKAYAHSLHDAILALAKEPPTQLSREHIAHLWPLWERAREAGRRLEAALKLALASGPLELPDGRIASIERYFRRKLNVVRGLQTLQKHLTDEEIEHIIQASIGAVTELVRAKAPKGQKAAAEQAFLAELEARGALWTESAERLVFGRRKEDDRDRGIEESAGSAGADASLGPGATAEPKS